MRIFSFHKQIKPSTDKNFTRYADQIAKIAKWSRIFEKHFERGAKLLGGGDKSPVTTTWANSSTFLKIEFKI
jgi:hypothetical protein